MKRIAIIFILSYFIACAISGRSRKYCNKKLCPQKNARHIGCRNSREFSPSCPKDSQIISMVEYQDDIIDLHNKLRNKVASGELKGFSKATRMATMTWDKELAYLAELNARRCVAMHDSCHNTNDFTYSGQNIGTVWSKPGPAEPRKGFMDIIKCWFDEHKYSNMTYIRNFRSNPKHAIEHFSAMVIDKNTNLGCSASQYRQNDGIELLLVCNYASTNVVNHPIYKNGRIASKCRTGNNSKYRALCSKYESMDVNKWV